jgi:hypothetical protein
MSEKYEIQGDESEVGGRNSNQGNKGIRNNEDIIKLTQNGEERFNQDEDETTSDNSDDKNDKERLSLINNVILSQELECDGENKGVNKDKTVMFAQDITDNTQSDSVDK